MSVRVTLIAVVFYLIYLAIAFGMSGFLSRQYEVLPQESTLTVAGTPLSTHQLAERYRPKFWLPELQQSPDAKRLLYEVIDNGTFYTLVYHPEWANEVMPETYRNTLYAIYRYIYYGLSLRDIEFIQLDIVKETGHLQRVRMETKVPSNTYNTLYQEHLQLTIERNSGGTYTQAILNTEGDTLEQQPIALMPTQPLHLRIATWNHLCEVEETAFTGVGHVRQQFELTYLSDAIYKKLKLARRSQGEFQTLESPMNTPIIFFVGILPLFYFVVILSDYLKNKNKFPHELEKKQS